jgi:hypothetical protein
VCSTSRSTLNHLPFLDGRFVTFVFRDAELCYREVKTDGKDGFSNCAISTGDHIIARPACLTPTSRYTIKKSEQLPYAKMGRGPSWRLMRAINPCGRPPNVLTRGHDYILCLGNGMVRLRRRDDSLSDPSIGLEDASKLETRSYIKLCPAATS